MIEANDIEREASAPLLVNIIKDKDIKAGLFDLDDTLFETSNYYKEVENALSADVCERFKSTVSTENFTEIISRLHDESWERRNHHPAPFYDECIEAFDMYFNGKVPDWCTNLVDAYSQNFYLTCPEFCKGAVDVIKTLKYYKKPFAFNSHATDGWTKLKSQRVAQSVDMRAIPYNAVNIRCKKDSDSWIKTARMVGTDMQDVLVFGDSLTSDVVPAIMAGCKNIIWIGGNRGKVEAILEDNSDVSIYTVRNLTDLLEYSFNY